MNAPISTLAAVPSHRLRYAAEKFACAVRVLAVTDADLHARLAMAWRELGPVFAEDIPAKARPQFVQLANRIHEVDNRGKVLRRLAELFVDIQFEVEREYEKQSRIC